MGGELSGSGRYGHQGLGIWYGHPLDDGPVAEVAAGTVQMPVDAMGLPCVPNGGTPRLPVIGMEGRSRRGARHHFVGGKVPSGQVLVDLIESDDRQLRDSKGMRIVATIVGLVESAIPDLASVRQVRAMIGTVEILAVPAIRPVDVQRETSAYRAVGNGLGDVLAKR
jgi:hypothetical protein